MMIMVDYSGLSSTKRGGGTVPGGLVYKKLTDPKM